MRQSHYSFGQNAKRLSSWAAKEAQRLKGKMEQFEKSYPVLCYSGMSGISYATALSLALEAIGVRHGMAYVRKDNERSHGQGVEVKLNYTSKHETLVPVFVDDFVCSGNTFHRVLTEIGRLELTQYNFKIRDEGTFFKLLDSEKFVFSLGRKRGFDKSGVMLRKKHEIT